MKKIRVLVCDDHAVFREGVKGILGRESDIEVVGEAGDGREAVQLVRKLDPDIVLMDISLPGIDGKEATRRLRAMDQFRDLPIIALTAHAIKGEDDEILASGVTDLITKPLDEDQLLQRLRHLIS